MRNGVLLKPSQVGTVWEAIEISKSASRGTMGWQVQGEARQIALFLSDLCVGLSTGQIKASSFLGMDGMAKLNHILRIEEELGDEARYGDRISGSQEA